MLDLTRLRVLVAVAREGSVTAAAQALHYAQPSVSHHLTRLEAELGVPLVQRAGRGIRLTEAGRLLATRAEEILGQVEAVRTELAAHAGLRTGRVRLAAFPSALAVLVPPAAAYLDQAHPDLELTLTEAEPPQALAALRNGDVDVALAFDYDVPASGPGSGPGSGPEGAANLTVTRLLDEPVYAVTPAGRRWPGPRNRLSTYAGERWIAGCPWCRAHLVDSCTAGGFAPDIAYETDDYVAVQALVAAGLGVSLLPGLPLIASRNPGVRIDRVPGDRRRVFAAAYGRPPAPLPVQAFLAALTATGTRPDWPR